MFSPSDSTRAPSAQPSAEGTYTRFDARSAPLLEMVVGNLVDEVADVLISPAADAGGRASRVQLALRRTAGDALGASYDAALASLPGRRLAPDENLVTEGFGLRCRHVVHCAPAPAPADTYASIVALERCLRAAFARATELGAESVALPAIGTGAYGYRVSAVSVASIRCAIEAQREARGPRRIRFVLAGPATLESFLHALSDQKARSATESFSERDIASR